jgi:hypothetical protein
MTRTLEEIAAEPEVADDDPVMVAAQLEAEWFTAVHRLAPLIDDLAVALAACPPLQGGNGAQLIVMQQSVRLAPASSVKSLANIGAGPWLWYHPHRAGQAASCQTDGHRLQ